MCARSGDTAVCISIQGTLAIVPWMPMMAGTLATGDVVNRPNKRAYPPFGIFSGRPVLCCSGAQIGVIWAPVVRGDHGAARLA